MYEGHRAPLRVLGLPDLDHQLREAEEAHSSPSLTVGHLDHDGVHLESTSYHVSSKVHSFLSYLPCILLYIHRGASNLYIYKTEPIVGF